MTLTPRQAANLVRWTLGLSAAGESLGEDEGGPDLAAGRRAVITTLAYEEALRQQLIEITRDLAAQIKQAAQTGEAKNTRATAARR